MSKSKKSGSTLPADVPPLSSPVYFNVPIGHLRPVQLDYLQRIKDAMVHTMLLQISDTGIDKNDRHFDVWQTIYLEADYQAGRLQAPR